MRILLINPPYRAVSSAHGLGEQTPLGPLAIGGSARVIAVRRHRAGGVS